MYDKIYLGIRKSNRVKVLIINRHFMWKIKSYEKLPRYHIVFWLNTSNCLGEYGVWCAVVRWWVGVSSFADKKDLFKPYHIIDRYITREQQQQTSSSVSIPRTRSESVVSTSSCCCDEHITAAAQYL